MNQQQNQQVCDQQECSIILKKDLVHRSKDEMDVLINFMSSIDFFKLAQIPRDTFNDYIIQICMYMKLVRFNKGQSVYDFGDKDKNFYLILQGNFAQYIPVNLQQKQEDIEQQFIELLQIDETKYDKYFNSFGECIFQPFAVQQELEVFGESMINNMHLNRCETMVSCQDNSEVGVISLEKYIEIIQNCWLGIKFDVETIESFVEQKFNTNQLLKMFKFQQEAQYETGQFIYKEGDVPVFIYLIKQGEINLCKKVQANENNQQNFKQAYITKLYQGMLVGEKEVVDGQNREYSAIASSDCLLYVISAEKFKQISLKQQKINLNQQINLINQKTPVYIMGGKKTKPKLNNYQHQNNYGIFQQNDNNDKQYKQSKQQEQQEQILAKLTFKTYKALNKYTNPNQDLHHSQQSDRNKKIIINSHVSKYNDQEDDTQSYTGHAFSQIMYGKQKRSSTELRNPQTELKQKKQESFQQLPKIHYIDLDQILKNQSIPYNYTQIKPPIQTNFVRQGRKALKIKLQKQQNLNELFKIEESNPILSEQEEKPRGHKKVLVSKFYKKNSKFIYDNPILNLFAHKLDDKNMQELVNHIINKKH